MPEPTQGMSASEASIKRRLREGGTNLLWCSSRPGQGRQRCPREAVEAAISQANEATSGGRESLARGRHVFQSSAGAMFFLVSDGSMDDVRGWLSTACAALELGGWRGTLHAPSNSWGGWPAEQVTTRKVVAFARDWVNEIRGTNYFMHGGSRVKVGQLPPPELIVAALNRSGSVRISTLGLKPLISRDVSLSREARLNQA